MPAAIAGPAIGAGASLIGGLIGGHQQDKATKANLSAQHEALAYEREKDAQRKAEYDKAVDIYKQQQAAWMTNRAAILGRYGVHLPAQAPPGAPGMMSGGPSSPPRAPVTLGMIAGAQPTPVSPGSVATPPQGAQAPQDAFDWQNWSRYAPIR